jgi:hypothetical protein
MLYPQPTHAGSAPSPSPMDIKPMLPAINPVAAKARRCGRDHPGAAAFRAWPGPTPAALLPLLMLWLNKGTKMASSLVIGCSGLAVGVSASRVVALPLHCLSRGDPR